MLKENKNQVIEKAVRKITFKYKNITLKMQNKTSF